MNKNANFEDLVAKKRPVPAKPTEVPGPGLPVKGGRQTNPDGVSTMGDFFAEMSTIHPDFNLELLAAMEKLAICNGEVSQAVDNIVTLGNTTGSFPKNIFFDDAVSKNKEMVKVMIARLKERCNQWYGYSGGMNSLVNDLLSQIAINGALSAEKVPNNQLDGVDKVVIVAPKTIRFRYNKEAQSYLPYQINTNGTQVISTNTNGTLLNTVTYSYKSYRKSGEKPYGIPPFIAALENIVVSKDIMGNLKAVIKKLGVLGFLEVLVNGPKPAQGEDDKQYLARTELYLNQVVPEIEKGLSKGFAVGFKGMHEFNMHPSNNNVQGARELVEMNDVKLMSGLKQDPSMLGRNFSTTETLARVIIAKTSTQVGNYQKIVASFLQELFLLDLQLAGYPVKTVEVEFDAPMIGDEVAKQDAEGKKIDNAKKKYDLGITDMQQMANELGYEEPAEEEPRQQLMPINPNLPDPNADPQGNKKTDPKKQKDPGTKKGTGKNQKLMPWQAHLVSSMAESGMGFHVVDIELVGGVSLDNVVIVNGEEFLDEIEAEDVISMNQVTLFSIGDLRSQYEAEVSGHTEQYMYEVAGCTCTSHGTQSFAKGSGLSKLESFSDAYFDSTKVKYTAAVRKSVTQIIKAMASLPEAATEQMVNDTVLFTMFKNWGVNFTKPQEQVVAKFVKNIYTFYRNDKTIFNGSTKKVPDAVFNQLDLRALEYYKKSDMLYMGKFITDEDTKRKMTGYIKDNYLNGDLPIGNNKAAIAKFRAEFGDVLLGEEWKLTRIISTTVNKMRNTAAVNYMNTAEVESFEIVGVPDSHQCGYCAALKGKVFSVSVAADRAMNMLKAEPTMVGIDAPFITSVYKKPEDMKDLEAVALQAAGIGMPPFHPGCRDTVAAIL